MPEIEIKCQTNGYKTPRDAINTGCSSLLKHLDDIKTAFDQANSNFDGKGMNSGGAVRALSYDQDMNRGNGMYQNNF